MAVLFTLIVAVTVTVHFTFIAYVVLGGFMALRLPRTLVLHVAAVAWGAAGLALDLPCPLTDVERWARAGAGMAPLPPDGFIAHYLTGVVYPASWATAVQLAVLATVVMSWVVAVRRRQRAVR
ncbi:DUF2784 domain-containing protein [Mycolicibacterium mageritense]|uniref:DUF2784 domain-containing protein n=1 Tax=Mycolicibacterium mageritense TaxID=53462 RepID=A0AAI8U0V3_MYCME|nr:DUF2784 domain-containing protein [Mycolicibacterium mageritense]BDY32594.1 hypothetical protein hbim_06563 [Mycolicibacterium mageritense]